VRIVKLHSAAAFSPGTFDDSKQEALNSDSYVRGIRGLKHVVNFPVRHLADLKLHGKRRVGKCESD
jgi:hypothetical protein